MRLALLSLPPAHRGSEAKSRWPGGRASVWTLGSLRRDGTAAKLPHGRHRPAPAQGEVWPRPAFPADVRMPRGLAGGRRRRGDPDPVLARGWPMPDGKAAPLVHNRRCQEPTRLAPVVTLRPRDDSVPAPARGLPAPAQGEVWPRPAFPADVRMPRGLAGGRRRRGDPDPVLARGWPMPDGKAAPLVHNRRCQEPTRLAPVVTLRPRDDSVPAPARGLPAHAHGEVWPRQTFPADVKMPRGLAAGRRRRGDPDPGLARGWPMPDGKAAPLVHNRRC